MVSQSIPSISSISFQLREALLQDSDKVAACSGRQSNPHVPDYHTALLETHWVIFGLQDKFLDERCRIFVASRSSGLLRKPEAAMCRPQKAILQLLASRLVGSFAILSPSRRSSLPNQYRRQDHPAPSIRFDFQCFRSFTPSLSA